METKFSFLVKRIYQILMRYLEVGEITPFRWLTSFLNMKHSYKHSQLTSTWVGSWIICFMHVQKKRKLLMKLWLWKLVFLSQSWSGEWLLLSKSFFHIFQYLYSYNQTDYVSLPPELYHLLTSLHWKFTKWGQKLEYV